MKTSITKEFAKYLRGSGILFAMQQGISIPFQLLIAMLTGKMVTFAVAGDGNAVWKQGTLLLGCVVSYKVFETLLKICYNRKLTVSKQKCKMRLYNWYMENPLYKLYSFEQGNFLERVNDDFSTVTKKFYQWIPQLIINFLATVIYFLYVGMESWILALLFLVLAMVQVLPELAIKGFAKKIYAENRDVEAKVTEYMVAAYRGFSTIKNFDLTEWYMQRLKKLHDVYAVSGNQSIAIGTVESSAQQLVSYLLQYGIYVGAGVLVLWGKIPLNIAIVSIALSGNFFQSVQSIFTVIPEFAVINVATKRLEEWKIFPKEERKLMEETGVRLVDVSFSYGEKQIFSQKNEIWKTDEICIIKGENGCGKSTLLKMIAGLISCDAGFVAVGKDIANNEEELRDGMRILYLSQERLHMDITAEEYLRLFSGVDEQKLHENLRAFHIDDKLLHSHLNTLSGGEEKKIMLSIMLAMSAPLLLLDEPETSLDVEGQSTLAKKLKERGRGILMVSHGENFDDIADRIYQIEKEKCYVS